MIKKFDWKGTPMDHQVATVYRAYDKSEFAIFHEMGTGKTYTLIHLALMRFRAAEINAVVVMCPTSLKGTWKEQIKEWADVESQILIINTGTTERDIYRFLSQPATLKWLVLGIEALSQGGAFDLALKFVKATKCMAVIDESTTIKNSTSVRTKRAGTLGAKSLFRIIMTGTPITQGLEDLFGQFTFLDPDIVGCKRSLTLFKRKYCIMGGFEGRKILGYVNEQELLDKVAPYTSIIRKEAVLDLPDKVYKKVVVDLTKEQERAIKELQDTFTATSGDDLLVTSTILERLTRYQQILGGHFPFVGEEGFDVKELPGQNPKAQALMDLVTDLPNDVSVIIWARFRPEIKLIVDQLRAKFGEGAVAEFHGGIDDDGREKAVADFRSRKARFFVSNQATGGMGLTLVEATQVIYYSNSFSLQDRLQSEDRCHRKGQTNKVTYTDIIADSKYDRMILSALEKKLDLAKFVEEKLTNQPTGEGTWESKLPF